MQVRYKSAADKWHLDESTMIEGQWCCAWRAGRARRPTRWTKSKAGMSASGLVVERGDLKLWVNLPAEVEVRGEGPYDVSIALDIEQPSLRVVVTSFTLSQRSGGPPVNAQGLRTVPLGELLDWALARSPIAEASDMGQLTPGHPAVADAVRLVRPRTGKRVQHDLEAVAAAVRAASPRSTVFAVQKALSVSESGAKRLLREARVAGVLEHSGRSSIARPSRGRSRS